MSLTANVSVSASATQVSALDLGSGEFKPTLSSALALTDGTGASQADRIFTDTRTLSASANEDLDLAGSLTDAFGATITFVKIKAIIITAASGNTNNVNVTRASSNGVPAFLAAGDGVGIPPGGFFAFAAGGAAGLCTVTAGTGDLLNIANSAGSTGVTYSIVIIGTSA